MAQVPDSAPAPVHEEVVALRDRWGSIDLTTEVTTAGREDYESFLPYTDDDGVFRFAATWIRQDGEVLLVQPADDEGWTGPGGEHEPGESFAETARRETREEAGIDCALTDVLETRLTVLERPDRRSLASFGVVFHARPRADDPDPVRQESEIDDLGWFSTLPTREDLVFEWIADYPV